MMNFLSHFYFERNNNNANMILGVVLPDFIKNADKTCNLYPLKEQHTFDDDQIQLDLLKGWKRHLEVDGFFHNSEFFSNYTHTLKQMLLPALKGSVVKPFFLAHIGLELMLDHLLIVNEDLYIAQFYKALRDADKIALEKFLNNCSLLDTTAFFKFLSDFTSSEYLFSYEKMENISYALNRICMRIWADPLSEHQLSQLTESLRTFKNLLQNNYLSIFEEIEPKLN